MRKYIVFSLSLTIFFSTVTSNAYGNGIPLPTFISYDSEADKYVVTENGDFSSDAAYDEVFTRSYADSSLTYLGNLNINFDGNNKEILGLSKPLFESIGINAEVSDLKLVTSNLVGGFIAQDSLGTGVLAKVSEGTIVNVQVSGNIDADNQNYVGGLVGQTYGGTIENVTSDVNISNGGYYVGGVVGYSNSTISETNSEGDIEGFFAIGGLVGESNVGIFDSRASGNITGIMSGFWVSDSIGGLVGRTNVGSDVTNSSFSGNVSGANNVGGLIGDSQGNVSGTFATGTVSGTNWVGGLIGYATSANIQDSWSSSQVTGNESVGGLVGASFRNSTIQDSYATGLVEGQNQVGGLVGTSFTNSSAYDENLITNSHSNGMVTGDYLVGGLVGSMGDPYIGYNDTYRVEIRNSYASGNVIGSTYSVGGLVGQAFGLSVIQNSLAFGDVSGDNNIGGLVGLLQGSIESSRALGDISGVSTIGGLVGQQVTVSSITDSAAYGDVSGSLQEGCGTGPLYCDKIGGLVGFMNSGTTISNSFAMGNVTGYESVGAIVGESYGEITNSWATGVQSSFSTNSPEFYSVGFCGRATNRYFCDMGDGSGAASNLLPEVLPSSYLSLENQLQILNFENETTHFASRDCINTGSPYLLSLASSYSNSCFSGGMLKILGKSKLNKSKLTKNFIISSQGPKSSCGFDVKDKSLDLPEFRINYVEPNNYDFFGNVFLGIYDYLQIGLNSNYIHDWEVWIKDPNCGDYKVGELDKTRTGFTDAVLPSIEFKAKGNFQILFRKPSGTSNSNDVPTDLQIFVTVE